MDLWREAPVHTEELLVHERQAVERLHARVVHALCVLYLACNGQRYACIRLNAFEGLRTYTPA